MPKLPAILLTWLARLGARPVGPLALLWLAAQAWALRHGPVVVYDSARYLRHAALLAAGRGAEAPAHYAGYVGYGWYLSLFEQMGLSPAALWAPVLGQVLLNGAATLAWYDAVRRLTADRRAAFLATAAVLAWPDLQRFSAYILTESLFTSALLLALWALARVAYPGRFPSSVETPPTIFFYPLTNRHRGPETRAPALTLLPFALFTLLTLATVALIRPNGFLVPGTALAAGLLWAWGRAGKLGKAGLLVALLGGVAALWPALNRAAGSYHLIETYVRGQLISGYTGWLVRPAAPLVLPPVTLPKLQQVAWFAAHQPAYFGRLAAGKVLAFVAYAKPFWSASHIGLSVAVLWPAWLLAARGLRRPTLPVGARRFAAALLLGQAAVVALTIEDWDARFLTPLLPIVFGLAVVGLRRKSAT